MPKKTQIDQDTLRHLVETEKLQHKKIAEILGVHRDTVGRRCKELGLSTQKPGPRRGKGHKGWKGGVRIVKGYRYLYRPDHPHATKSRYVAEHRLSAEEKLGRLLHPDEVVHHLDGDRLNNHPDNLGVFRTNAHHLRETLKGRRPNWSESGKQAIIAGCQRAIEQGHVQTANLLKSIAGDHPPPQSTDHPTTQS